MSIKFAAQCTGYNFSYAGDGTPQAQVTFTGANEKGEAFNNKEETGISAITVSMTLHGETRNQVKGGDVRMFTMEDDGTVTIQPAGAKGQAEPSRRGDGAVI